jgi:MFS family permease
MLVLLTIAEVFGMSMWFTGGAVAPHLRDAWGLDAGQTGWLMTAVQLGFVAGTALAAALNLADVLPSRAYFAASATLGAVANAALVVAPGFGVALVTRFLTGVSLAGVYPPAMKMVATWFRSDRGLAIGTIVGALTIGSASPYLLRAIEGADHRSIILISSIAALASAILVGAAYRDGPFRFEPRPFSWKLVGTILRHRPTRLAIAGYVGHMWELYAMWTWIPVFVLAGLSARPADPVAGWVGDLIAFGAIAIGGIGCVWGGVQADRIGRERLVNLAMGISGICALAIGLFFGANPWLLALVTWIWGFFVIADSAQFSALITEVSPRHAVGTALTLQTSIGFLLTIVTIQWIPGLVEMVGWRWAFAVLALGPFGGIAAMRRLRQLREGREAA